MAETKIHRKGKLQNERKRMWKVENGISHFVTWKNWDTTVSETIWMPWSSYILNLHHNQYCTLLYASWQVSTIACTGPCRPTLCSRNFVVHYTPTNGGAPLRWPSQQFEFHFEISLWQSYILDHNSLDKVHLSRLKAKPINSCYSTCAEFYNKPQVICCLVPFVEVYNMNVIQFVGEAHPVGRLRPLTLVDAVHCHKIDRSLLPSFVYCSCLISTYFIIQYEVFHLYSIIAKEKEVQFKVRKLIM